MSLFACLLGCGQTSGAQYDFGSTADASKDAKSPGTLRTDGRVCGTDANAEGCPCALGQSRACYTGPAGTEGVGACRAGTQTCVGQQEGSGTFGPCFGEVVPSTGSGACLADASAPVDAAQQVADAWVSAPCDACSGSVSVLFGGNGWGDGILADTWLWDGKAWTESYASSPPPPRSNAAMASLGGKLVLFGGEGVTASGTADFLADTWTWSAGTWTHAAATGPAPRFEAAIATLGDKVVLFGGGDDNKVFSDTWTWDGSAWTELQVRGPGPRWGAVMAPLNGKLVMFGGIGTFDGGTAFGDTWTWDGTTWTQVATTGPAGRLESVMAPLGDKLVLFGGSWYGDTWTWDGAAWTQLQVNGPPAREAAVMAPLGDKLVLFGGEGSGISTLTDTWTWDGTAWTQPGVNGPPQRFWAVMATP